MGKRLWDMEVGECRKVETISCDCPLRRRLMELGFVGGSAILCVGKSPFGDPKAYLVRGVVLALRKTEGQFIIVEED